MQIRAKDKERILEIVEVSFKIPIEILAFGSRVKNTAHEGSDLDLAIKNISLGKNFSNYIKIFKENLKESNIPIFVQVIDWETLPSNYKTEIQNQHEVFFKNTL